MDGGDGGPGQTPGPSRYLMFGFIQHKPPRLPGFHEGAFLVQRPLVGPAGQEGDGNSGVRGWEPTGIHVLPLGEGSPSRRRHSQPIPSPSQPIPSPACLFSLSDVWNWL